MSITGVVTRCPGCIHFKTGISWCVDSGVAFHLYTCILLTHTENAIPLSATSSCCSSVMCVKYTILVIQGRACPWLTCLHPICLSLIQRKTHIFRSLSLSLSLVTPPGDVLDSFITLAACSLLIHRHTHTWYLVYQKIFWNYDAYSSSGTPRYATQLFLFTAKPFSSRIPLKEGKLKSEIRTVSWRCIH